MKRSDIKVGDVVAVYIDWPKLPEGFSGFGTQRQAIKSGIPQSDKQPGRAYYRSNDRYTFKGTVIATDAVRYTRRGSYSSSELIPHEDGILVEVAPFKVDYNTKKTYTQFVAKPVQIIEPWEKVEARQSAQVESDAKWDAKADAFAPVLAKFLADLRERGLRVSVHTDGSGITGDVHITLYKFKSRPYAFARGGTTVSMGFDLFERLTGIEVPKEDD